MWQYTGQKRPSFAEQPKAGQESVWDYPRPPRVEVCQHTVEVIHKVNVIARSVETYRVLETASPPTFYIPKQDIDWSLLVETSMTSVCEWKGLATYWKLASDPDGPPVAWRYDDPKREYSMLRECTSFYPSRVACYVNREHVLPQSGEFYGGWITSEIVGPFKGDPGTGHW